MVPNEAAEHGFHLLGSRRPRILLNCLKTSLDQPAAKGLIPQQTANSREEGGDVADWHQQAVVLVAD